MLKNKINILYFIFFIFTYAYLSNPYINKIELNYKFHSLDGVNIDHAYYLYWRYNYFYGLKPFKDFWYPYGGYFYFNAYVFPWIFIEYIFKVFLLSTIIYSIFNILNKSRINFFYFIIFWLGCVYIFKLHNFANYRYYIPLACILYSYICLIKNSYLNNFFLSILLSTLFFLEANLLGAILPSILFLVICFYLKKDLRVINFFFTVILSIFFIILYLFYLYKDHALPNFINFHLDLKHLLLYSALDYNFLSWFKYFNHDNLLIFSLIFIITSAFFFLNSKVQQVNKTGLLIFSLFLLIISLSFKQLFRPHMAWELLIICFFSVFIIVLNFNNLINIKKLKIFLFFLALLFTLDLIKSFEKRLLKHVNIFNDAFEKYILRNDPLVKKNFSDKNFIINNNNSAVQNSSDDKNIIKDLFDPKFFFINEINGQTLIDEFHKQIPDLNTNDFFLLGDEIYFYPLFKLKPYRSVTFYNTSLIKDQINLINEIKSRSPKYVFFNPVLFKKEISARFSDGVPSTIRNPILYKYISQNYKFYKTIFGMDILILSKFDNKNLFYWDKILGKDLNLGFIPAASSEIINNNTDCDIQNDKCSYFLTINISKPLNNKKYMLSIKNNNSFTEYKIFFNQIQKKNTYVIHLNNLWFWKENSKPNEYTIEIASKMDKFSINYFNNENPRLY
jgi:hypothetical protein